MKEIWVNIVDVCCLPCLEEIAHSLLCFRLQQVNLSQNQLKNLPTGLLHLTRMQKLSASKNQLAVLFDLPDSTLQLS